MRRVLVDAGLVISQRRGRTNLCSLNHESIGVIEEWVAARKSALDLRLQRFADYLEAEKGPMQ